MTRKTVSDTPSPIDTSLSMGRSLGETTVFDRALVQADQAVYPPAAEVELELD